MKNGKKSVSLIFSLLMAVIFSVPCLLNTAHSNETASREVVLGNGYKISLLSVSYDFKRTKSTWRYRVEELPSAQDLSNWMLELYDCHKVIGATPTSWWIENPDPNFHLNGIKWQGAGVQGSAEFTVTIKGNWKVGNNQVGAKGPDVAIGRLAGPSCEVYTQSFPGRAIYLLLLQNKPLYINEFLAANAGTKEDADWIEIYNSDNSEVNLQNYYLTNDLSNLTKYKIEDEFYIPANGFVVFYADNDSLQGVNYLNFLLDTDSGELALVKPDGETIVDSYTYGLQSTGQSEGRCTDNLKTWTFFSVPTSGSLNGTCK